MAHIASIDWSSLEPMWVSVIESGTMDDRPSTINYGTKIQSTGGNNGAGASGYVKGTARGSFKIQFKLGYYWGWSTLYAANVSKVTQTNTAGANSNQSGANGISFLNNSSNNKFLVYKGVSGTQTEITNASGLNNVMITFWRDANNVCYYKAGSNNTVTLGTFADHWSFYCTQQSPCSTELISAFNDRDAAS